MKKLCSTFFDSFSQIELLFTPVQINHEALNLKKLWFFLFNQFFRYLFFDCIIGHTIYSSILTKQTSLWRRSHVDERHVSVHQEERSCLHETEPLHFW